jgi:hypothetical protein
VFVTALPAALAGVGDHRQHGPTTGVGRPAKFEIFDCQYLALDGVSKQRDFSKKQQTLLRERGHDVACARYRCCAVGTRANSIA